jgi:hypothetical protein
MGSELAEADLRSTIAGRPHGYVLPKAEFAEQVEALAEFLALEERARGWPAGQIKILPIVETALGVMAVREIALADPRVDALLFGAEDLAGDMGAVRTPAGWEVFYARSAVVMAAKAYRLQAIDQVLLRSERPGGLRGRVPDRPADGLRRQDGDPSAPGRDRPARLRPLARGDPARGSASSRPTLSRAGRRAGRLRPGRPHGGHARGAHGRAGAGQGARGRDAEP